MACRCLGGPAPLDETLLRKIRQLSRPHQVRCYTEHLSYCSDDGHLYDLMPIPFTAEAVTTWRAASGAPRTCSDRRIGIENVSYYAAPGAELSEIEFINAVVEEADCDLLLDVNKFTSTASTMAMTRSQFLRAMPGERVVYGHIAGHYKEAEDLRVDTHGADVIDAVWELLDRAYRQFGVFPTLLERDFNFPPHPDTAGRGRRRSAPPSCSTAPALQQRIPGRARRRHG